MRPGQLQPNEFERAILRSFASLLPSLLPRIDSLHVLSREHTGWAAIPAFSTTTASLPRTSRSWASIMPRFTYPTVPSGLGAVLLCRGDQPTCLELFTYGDEPWDGVYDGFSIHPTV